MKAYAVAVRVLLVAGVTSLAAVVTPAFAQSCTQTISPGTSVATAIANAAAGSTICLNTGSYGSVNVSNVAKSPRVTVRSATGKGASFSLSVTGSSRGLTFDSVTLTSMTLGSNGSNTYRDITVQNSDFRGVGRIYTVNLVNANILLDNNTHINICSEACGAGVDGRLHIYWPGGPGNQPCGVTVRNSLFENLPPYNVGESDGINIGAYGVVVGPGNIFRGLKQGNFQNHVDSVQMYGASHTTIIGNYFYNNDVMIMAPDGGNTETITNNVFVGGGYGPAIQMGSHNGSIFTHNTVINFNVHLDNKSGNPASSNALVRDNIFRGGTIGSLNCTNCTITHNMFSSGGRGTDMITGSPTFIGGTNPSTWEGFQLAATSLGYKLAIDPIGSDMGSNYYGDTASDGAPPNTPTGLVLQ
jgi:hypothetical protein